MSAASFRLPIFLVSPSSLSQMGCTFCATGSLGLSGNLTAGEICEQVRHRVDSLGCTYTRVQIAIMGVLIHACKSQSCSCAQECPQRKAFRVPPDGPARPPDRLPSSRAAQLIHANNALAEGLRPEGSLGPLTVRNVTFMGQVPASMAVGLPSRPGLPHLALLSVLEGCGFVCVIFP